jgi:hypothetical protein
VNRISRLPTWLYQALRLEQPTVPTDFDTTAILPTLDVFQGGLAIAENRFVSGTVPASTAATTVANEPRGQDEVQLLIWFLDATHNGGAAPLRVSLDIREPSSVVNPAYLRKDIAVGARAIGEDWLGVGGRIWLPPGIGFRLLVAATGVGETVDYNFGWLRIPAGFKVI